MGQQGERPARDTQEAPRRPVPRTAWRTALRTVATLRAFEQVTALGWSMPVRTFRTLARVLTALAVLGVTAVAIVLLDVVRLALLPSVPAASRGAVLLTAALAACGYALALGLWREAVTRRRDLVSASPHAALFRALDVPATAVFAVWVVPAVARTTALLMGLAVAFVAVYDAELSRHVTPVALLGLPLAVGALQLTVAALAARPTAAAGPGGRAGLGARARTGGGTRADVARWAGLGAATVLAGLAGRLAAQAGGAVGGGWPTWRLSASATTGVVVGVTAAALLTAAAVVLRVRAQLVARPFPVGAEREVRPLRRRRPAPAPGRWVLAAVLAAAASGRPGRLRRRWWTGAVLAAGVAYGLAPLVQRAPVEASGRVAVLMTFLSALALTESGMEAAGPTALAGQLRAVHELGAPSRRLAAALAGAAALDMAAVGVGVTVVAWCATGALDASPVVVAVAVAAASVLADAAAPGRVRSDGSAAVSMGAALITVLATVPVTALLMTPAGAGWLDWAAAAVAALILTGGVACVRRTVIVRPSTMPA